MVWACRACRPLFVAQTDLHRMLRCLFFLFWKFWGGYFLSLLVENAVHHHSPCIHIRTAAEASEIYDAGQTICKSHKLLTAIHIRQGFWGVVRFFLTKDMLGGWLDPDRQQIDWSSRGILKPIQWVMKPKVHSFDHQLQLILRTRLNSRHTHCFVDEDGMKHLKALAVRHPSVNLEAFILRASRLRMKLSAKKMASLRRSSARKSKRWKKQLCVAKACAHVVCSNCLCLHFRAFAQGTLFWRPFGNGPHLEGLWRFRVYIYIYRV